jgi:hypothetical protein
MFNVECIVLERPERGVRYSLFRIVWERKARGASRGVATKLIWRFEEHLSVAGCGGLETEALERDHRVGIRSVAAAPLLKLLSRGEQVADFV